MSGDDRGEANPERSPRSGAWQPRRVPEPVGEPDGEPSSIEPAAPQAPGPERKARFEDIEIDLGDLDQLDLEEAGIYASPQAVGGDVVLSGEGATSDLSARSAARLSGRAIALAGVVVVAGVVLSRVLGWARTSVFLAQFSQDSRPLAAFQNAFSVPDTLFQLVAAGAVGSALVPVASGLLAIGESERARKLISTIANLTILALVPLAVLAWIAAPGIMGIIAPSTDAATLDWEIGLTRVMLLSPIFLAVGAVMSAGLNASGIFGAPALAPNVYNVAIIVAAIALTPVFGIYGLAIGVVAGAGGMVLTQAGAVRRLGLYRPHLYLDDPAVRETLLLMAPRALGLGATQIVFVVNRYFADSLPGNTAVNVYAAAFTALQIPVGLIGVPLGIVMLPQLSQAIARHQDERYRSLVDQSLRLLLFVVVPLTLLMLALARPSLLLLYRYGAESEAMVNTMVPVFQVFLVGLVAHVLIALLAPIFYAGKDTRTPVAAALVAVAVDVVAAAMLFPIWQLNGLALAISLGAWAEVVILGALMERRIGIDLKPLIRDSAAFAGGGAVAAAAAYITAGFVEQHTGGPVSLFARIVELVPAGLVGLGVYLAWARAFRLPELGAAVDLARTLTGRRHGEKGRTRRS